MAESDLIAAYLDELRGRLRWRADAADLVDEAEDHLRLSADRLARCGGDPLEAQRLTLTRFGDPAVVARAFAAASPGGLVMPTAFTRTAGRVALAAALGWLALAVLAPFTTGALSEYSDTTYAWTSVLATAAVAATLVAVVGMLARAGERSGPWMIAAVALGTLAVAAAVVATWGIVGWGLLISLACAIGLVRMRAAGVQTRPLDWALLAAWPVSIGLWVLLDALKVGDFDSYGDYPTAAATGIAALGLLMAVGLFSVGRRLAAEAPADVPQSAAPAARA